jgi:hypothetical protein
MEWRCSEDATGRGAVRCTRERIRRENEGYVGKEINLR